MPTSVAAMAASTVTHTPSDPSESLDQRERLAALSHAPPPPLRSHWDRILKRCLQADPKLRLRNVDGFASPWGPSATRRRVLLLAGAVMLAAAAALVTYRQSTAPAQTVRLAVGCRRVHSRPRSGNKSGNRWRNSKTARRSRFPSTPRAPRIGCRWRLPRKTASGGCTPCSPICIPALPSPDGPRIMSLRNCATRRSRWPA